MCGEKCQIVRDGLFSARERDRQPLKFVRLDLGRGSSDFSAAATSLRIRLTMKPTQNGNLAERALTPEEVPPSPS
jgi:hypothetical protein